MPPIGPPAPKKTLPRQTPKQARSLQRVIGKLDLFAALVRDRLATADWSTKREIICLLVKRIEVAKDVVRVVFRVDPSSSAPSEARQSLPTLSNTPS